MKEAEILGKLLPALPIIEKVREKYEIDSVNSGDAHFKEILLSDEQIDWYSVRQDIHEKKAILSHAESLGQPQITANMLGFIPF